MGKAISCFKIGVNIIYSIVFILFACNMLIKLNNLPKVIGLMALFLIVQFSAPKLLDKVRRRKFVKIIMCITFIILQMMFFMTVAVKSNWDTVYIREFAVSGLDCGLNWYFARWPNNTFSAMVVHIWVALTEKIIPFIDAYKRMVMLNVICVDIAVMAAYFCVKKLFNVEAAERTMITLLFCIGCNPWLEIVYTDTLSMMFPIIFFYLLLLSLRSDNEMKKKILLFVAFFIVTIGINVKPTVAIAIIAVFITAVIGRAKINMVSINKLLIIVTACIFGIILVKTINRPITDYNKIHSQDEKSRGMHYFIDTGITSFGLGEWTQEVFEWHNKNIYDENYEKLATERIINKVKQYKLKGMVEHLYKKLLYMGSDGTFSFGREGDFYTEELAAENTLKGKLQKYIYIKSELYQKWEQPWFNAIWLSICLQNIFSVFYKSKDEQDNNFIFASKLSVCGLFLFLMIFENRARYIFLYVPIIIMIAQSGSIAFKEKILK